MAPATSATAESQKSNLRLPPTVKRRLKAWVAHLKETADTSASQNREITRAVTKYLDEVGAPPAPPAAEEAEA